MLHALSVNVTGTGLQQLGHGSSTELAGVSCGQLRHDDGRPKLIKVLKCSLCSA